MSFSSTTEPYIQRLFSIVLFTICVVSKPLYRKRVVKQTYNKNEYSNNNESIKIEKENYCTEYTNTCRPIYRHAHRRIHKHVYRKQNNSLNI